MRADNEYVSGPLGEAMKSSTATTGRTYTQADQAEFERLLAEVHAIRLDCAALVKAAR